MSRKTTTTRKPRHRESPTPPTWSHAPWVVREIPVTFNDTFRIRMITRRDPFCHWYRWAQSWPDLLIARGSLYTLARDYPEAIVCMTCLGPVLRRRGGGLAVATGR